MKKILFNLLFILTAFLVFSNVATALEIDCANACQDGVWSTGAFQECTFGDTSGLMSMYGAIGVDRTVAAGEISGYMSKDAFLNGLHPDDIYAQACQGAHDMSQLGGVVPDWLAHRYKNSPRERGSALGMAVRLGEGLDAKDAIPINFAYYAKHQAGKLPIIGDTAFAQSQFVYLGADFVYKFWEQIRNISLIVISTAMLITGVLIMLRKQLPSKTAVTIQYAFPRLVIALVLIYFSYPIASFGVVLIPVLRNIGGEILANVGIAFGLTETTAADYNSMADMPLLAATLSRAGIAGIGNGFAILGAFATGVLGISAGFGRTTVFIVWLIIIAIAFLKSVIIQLQIMYHVIFSPLIFAWGAIPGNENMITDWFKKLGVKIISVAAIYFYIGIASLLLRASTIATLESYPIQFRTWYDIGAVGESILVWMFIPFLAMSTLIAAIGVPKKIDKAIMGPPKK